MTVAIVVQVTIDEKRLDEFKKVMEIDAVESRKEPGCKRFDVIVDPSANNKFVFYEVYENDEAVQFHFAQPHFKGWSDFKETGAVLEQSVIKGEGLFMS